MSGNEKVLQPDPTDPPPQVKADEKQPVVTLFAKIRDDYISKVILLIIGYLLASVVSFMTPDTADIEYSKICRDKFYDKSLRHREVEWHYKDQTVETMSVCQFYIHNRTSKDIPGVKLYFRVVPKGESKVPEILSKNLYPPERLPRVGIKEVNEGIDNLYAFDIDVVKKTEEKDSYMAEFLFKGVSAPEMSVSTNTKDVTVEEFSVLRSLMRIGRFMVPIGLAIIVLTFWLGYLGDRKRFSSIYKMLSTDKRPGLSREQIDIVLGICIDSLRYYPKSLSRRVLSSIKKTE
jgi:hypothetical protein